MLGVARRQPGRWENNETEPQMRHLVRIAEVTGRPIGFFFGETEASESDDGEEDE